MVTGLLFAVVHTRYDPFDMSAILTLGLLLGPARWFSGSLWLAYGLHAAINGVGGGAAGVGAGVVRRSVTRC